MTACAQKKKNALSINTFLVVLRFLGLSDWLLLLRTSYGKEVLNLTFNQVLRKHDSYLQLYLTKWQSTSKVSFKRNKIFGT